MRRTKFILLVLFTAILMTVISQPALAAADKATTFTELGTKLHTAMSSRLVTYNIQYIGDTSVLKKDLDNMVNSIYAQDDYLYYSMIKCAYSGSISGNKADLTFEFSYWTDAAQAAYVNNQVTAILAQIITPDMNDYQKEKAIHDWIVKNVAYDDDLKQHSDYAALVSPYKTVCQGYTLLAYKMLSQTGIPVKIVEGRVNSEEHTWNEVCLEGIWYHLDCTWDDQTPDVPGHVSYGYYNLTDAQILGDHSWAKDYPPAITDFGAVLDAKISNDASRAGFYQGLKNDLGFQYLAGTGTAASSSDIREQIQKAVKNQQTEITFRYMHGSSLKKDLQNAINNVSKVSSCKYSTSDYKITSLTDDIIVELMLVYR